jgi:hypothetical protein
METNKITAQALETAGFAQTQIDRYYEIQDRVRYYGFDALATSDRQFLRSAKSAVAKVDAAHKAALVAGRKNRLSGKTPVETKKHYRWVQAEINAFIAHADLAADEILCRTVVLNEILRALSLYQPVLDQVDTSKRSKFDQPYLDLVDLGNTYAGARVVQVDMAAVISTLRTETIDEWNTRWAAFYESVQMVAIPLSDELDYIRVVRPEIERLTREIYPSVTATV